LREQYFDKDVIVTRRHFIALTTLFLITNYLIEIAKFKPNPGNV